MIDVLLPLAAAVEGQSPITELLHRFGIDLPYLLSQIVSFGVVAFLLYRFAFKPVLATMDDRNAKIAEGLKHAEEMKAKLADAEKQHAEAIKKAALEAQKIIDEARTSAKTLLDRETAQATEKTQQMLAKAEQAIELERKKMLADVRDEISRLVALTAQRVLSRELGADERKRYTESAARELTQV
ncbi:MAG: F0F1 ATP synthase subunit B [Opitutaceae bacterium]|nr:F0F1 ATP synthase subunit B [Opitutaceae bacterium]